MADQIVKTAAAFAPLLANTMPSGIPVRYKAVHGGRGSGKSRFFSDLAVEEMLTDAVDIVCLREVQKSLRFSVKREIEAAIVAMNAGAYFDVQDNLIYGKGGAAGKSGKAAASCVCIFEGLQNHTAESLQSLALFKRALIEEAQSLSQRSLDILRPTIRSPGSQIWAAWNPKSHLDAVDQFFRGATPPDDAIVVRANYSDNPWFPDVLQKEMQHDKRTASPEKFAHIWGGAYLTVGDAQVFKNWTVQEFDTHEGALLRYGADWGFAIDPSVLVRCYLVGRKLYVDYEAYQVGCEIDRLPDLFMTVPESEKWPIVADSARPETVSYMRRNGFSRMTPATKGPGSVEDGISWLQSLEIVVHPRCRHTIDELTHYSYKTDPATGKPIPVLSDKNNHVIDSLRYACEGARRAAMSRDKPKPAHPVVTHGHGSWMSG
jgi:phage terminase large subunit